MSKIIILTTKRFDKKIVKLSQKEFSKFKERITLFRKNKNHALLKTHKLKGELKNFSAFSVTGDIRIIFQEEVFNDKVQITLRDVGTHSDVY